MGRVADARERLDNRRQLTLAPLDGDTTGGKIDAGAEHAVHLVEGRLDRVDAATAVDVRNGEFHLHDAVAERAAGEAELFRGCARTLGNRNSSFGNRRAATHLIVPSLTRMRRTSR